MSKNYSVEDILAEVKQKKETGTPGQSAMNRADSLIEELLLEKQIAEQAEHPTSSQPVLSEQSPRSTVSIHTEKSSDEAFSAVSKKKQNERGGVYFTRSFAKIDVEQEEAVSEETGGIGNTPKKSPKELLQMRLRAKMGLTFTQQLPDVPVHTKFGIVGGEEKLIQAQRQHTLSLEQLQKEIAKPKEKITIPKPMPKEPISFDTKSSLKLHLPDPNPQSEQVQQTVPEEKSEQTAKTGISEHTAAEFDVDQNVLKLQSELAQRREEAVKKFKMFGSEEPDNEEEEPIVEEELGIEDFESFEDVPAIQSDLNYTRFKVLFRLCSVGILLIASLYLGLSTAVVLPIPSVIDSAHDPLLFLLVHLFLLVICGFLCIGTIGRGLVSLFTFSPDSDSFAAAAFVGALVQNGVFLMNPSIISSAEGLQLLAPIALLILFINCIGKTMMIDRVRRNFRMVSSQYEKHATFLVDDPDFVYDMTHLPREEDAMIVGHAKAGFLRGFLEHSYAPDNADRLSRILAPVCFGSAIVVSVACYLLTNNFYKAATVFAAVLCMCCPAAAAIGMNLPLLRSSKSLSRAGAMIAGCDAVMEYGDALGVMVDVSDIIHPSDVEVNGLKMFKTARIDEAILNAASLVCRVESPLSGLFMQILQNRKDLLKPVDSVIYEDGMGLSGWVDGKRVLVGNRKLMTNHSIDIPKVEYERRVSRGTQHVVYVAVDGELTAMFLVLYSVSREVQAAVSRVIQNGFKIYLKTTDSNLDEKKIAELCGVSPDMVSLIPQYLYSEYDQKCSSRSNMKASVAYTGGVEAYFKALVSCVKLRSSVSLTSAFYISSVIIGLLLIVLFTLLGSIAVLKFLSVLVYQLFWIAAIIIITNIKRY